MRGTKGPLSGCKFNQMTTRLPPISRLTSIPALILILGLIGCGEGTGGQKGGGAGQRATAIMVEALVVQPRLLEHKIQTTGTLLANEEVELRPEVSGRIVGLHFEEGSRVRKGDLMLQINDAELTAQLRRKEYEEKLAADEEQRKRQLREINGISHEEYEKSLYLLKMIQAEREVIESQIRETQVRAPFDGVVGLRQVSDGGFITSNMLIATLQSLNPIKVEFAVPERHARQIVPDGLIRMTVGESSAPLTGRIFAVDARIDPGTRTLRARATVPNPDESLLPGAFARIEITLETIQDAVVVPAGAVIPEITGEKVFVCRGGTAQSVPVQTGLRLERDIQITGGLGVNDTLIVSGLLQIADGRPVQITRYSQP